MAGPPTTALTHAVFPGKSDNNRVVKISQPFAELLLDVFYSHSGMYHADCKLVKGQSKLKTG